MSLLRKVRPLSMKPGEGSISAAIIEIDDRHFVRLEEDGPEDSRILLTATEARALYEWLDKVLPDEA